jgi:hypothetical protein
MRAGWLALIVICAACGTDAVPNRFGDEAPLRRLSNTEYRYALNDVFPWIDVALPPLPADLAVSGFENDAEAQAPSDVRIARFESIASLYAAEATKDAAAITTLTACTDWSTPPLAAACKDQFVRQLGSRLFRRPLTVEEERRFGQRFVAWWSTIDFEGAVQLTLSAMLQSPQFLYRIETFEPGDAGRIVPLEPYAMASRLSFLLWESVPDDELLRAASTDELRSEAGIRKQTQRMLDDPRALRLAWDFHRQWLTLDKILNEEHQVRSAEIDAPWNNATQASALQESRLFVERSFRGDGTFTDLLTGRHAMIDSEMARVYGVPGPAAPGVWMETTLNDRAGLLTRTAFLAGYSHRAATSPPLRGNAVMLQLLCQLPAPPPAGVDLSMPVANPGDGPKTNRMLFEERTAPAACQGCHQALNGFGFGFENYTASGGFITEQQGLPIDPTGEITGTDVDGPFANAIELSSMLARSEVVYRCATKRWFQYAFGRLATTKEQPYIDGFADDFLASEGNLRALLTAITTSNLFRMRRVPAS